MPELPEDAAELEHWLARHCAERQVRLRVAQRGDKAALVQTAS